MALAEKDVLDESVIEHETETLAEPILEQTTPGSQRHHWWYYLLVVFLFAVLLAGAIWLAYQSYFWYQAQVHQSYQAGYQAGHGYGYQAGIALGTQQGAAQQQVADGKILTKQKQNDAVALIAARIASYKSGQADMRTSWLTWWNNHCRYDSVIGHTICSGSP